MDEHTDKRQSTHRVLPAGKYTFPQLIKFYFDPITNFSYSNMGLIFKWDNGEKWFVIDGDVVILDNDQEIEFV